MAVEVCIKSVTGAPDIPRDCHFCQRVLMTLEEKKVEYELQLIDLEAKPQWFLEVNREGKVPVIKFDDKWIADSDVIVGIYPNPSLSIPPEVSSVGSKIFPCFFKLLMSKDCSDGSEQAILDELKALDEHLKNKVVNPINTKHNAVDLSLAPKLHHIDVGWSVPQNLTHLHNYKKLLFSLDSFRKTQAQKEHIITSWTWGKIFERIG